MPASDLILHEIRDVSILQMRMRPGRIDVAGMNDHETVAVPEQGHHMAVEDFDLDQMTQDVECQRHIMLPQIGIVLGQEEGQSRLPGMALSAKSDCRRRDVKAHISLGSEIHELIAVAAAELEHPADLIVLGERVREIGLEFGQPPARPCPGVSSASIARVPVVRR